MERVLQEYKKYPLIFLFASDDVSEFYLKCGFRRINEIVPCISVSSSAESVEAERISMESKHIKRLLNNRLQRSAVIDARGNEEIYHFHLIYNFRESIYYIKEKDVIFIADYEEDIVNIYDIVSNHKISFRDIESYILKENTREVRFHFMPDWLKVDYKTFPSNDNALYVYGQFPENIKACRFPCTSVT